MNIFSIARQQSSKDVPPSFAETTIITGAFRIGSPNFAAASGGIPGGSDGVVPYSSSHLDNVESELVVRSGHSAQQFPLAIQEIRRILLEHLRQYPDSVLTSPLPFGGKAAANTGSGS